MQLSTEVVDDVGVVHVRGDVDHVDAPKLDEVAAQMLGDGARDLVIDCRHIDFIDSAGLQAMLRACNQARAQGGTVTLRRPSAFTYRLLQITGIDTMVVIDGIPHRDGDPVG